MSSINNNNQSNSLKNDFADSFNQDARTLFNILEKYRIKGHNSIKGNIIDIAKGQKFSLPIDTIEQFFIYYERSRLSGISFNYAEYPCKESGLMLDFDIHQNVAQRLIAGSDIRVLIEDLVDILKEAIDFSEEQKTFKIFVIQRPKITFDANDYKDGFHILIPELWMKKELKKYIVNKMIEKKLIYNIFGKYKEIKLDKMLDTHSTCVNPLLLGSRKKYVIIGPYELDYIYEIILGHRTIIDSINIPKGEINLAYELSLTFSFNHLNSKETWLKKSTIVPAIDLQETDDNNVIEEISDDPEFNCLSQIIDCIDIRYSDNYDTWFKGIIALSHNPSYRLLAHNFSKKSPKYKYNEVEEMLKKYSKTKHSSPVTIKTLFYYAKKSNIHKYYEIKSQSIEELFKVASKSNRGILTEANIAKILYELYKNKYVCCCDESKNNRMIWYKFITKKDETNEKASLFKWVRENPPTSLQLIMVDKFTMYIENIIRNLRMIDLSSADMKYADDIKSIVNNLERSKIKLQGTTFQNNVIAQATNKFIKRDFISSLDKYTNVIGVANGILITDPKLELIEGYHTYRICSFIEADYMPYNPNDPLIKKIEQMFKDILIGDGVYEKIMTIFSTALDRGVKEPLLLFMVGGGANGKSTIIQFMINALGLNFVYKAPSGLLLEYGNKSNEANSAHYGMKGKTIVFYDECDPYQTLNTKQLKNITNITQTGRDLRKKQENYTVNALHIYMTNHIPTVKTTDHGTWRRLLKFETKVKFTNTPNKDNKYEKLADDNFLSSYPNRADFKRALLSILAHHHSNYVNKYCRKINNIKSPTIDEETLAFRNENDTFNRFITETIIKTQEAETYTIQEIANIYIEWHNKTVSSARIDLREAMDGLKNSRLSSALRRIDSSKQVLDGYRISINGRLRAGESFFK